MDKIIGVVGGLSPYSTILYYKFLVEAYREKRGRDPRILLYSVPVQEMCSYVKSDNVEGARTLLSNALKALSSLGADPIILAANTPHVFLDDGIIRESIGDGEFIDIREAVLSKIKSLGVKKIGLLATKATVEKRLYHDYLEDHGIEVITPSRLSQERLDALIEKLTTGVIPGSEKLTMATIVSELVGKGAEAILYGCTELSLLIGRVSINKPVIDSLTEHVRYVIDKVTGTQ
ncbi:MAG: amino acid racemase [Desulfurococcales archaeon]|nr:amino acid racemase [Desulfurococcales archaeon]